ADRREAVRVPHRLPGLRARGTDDPTIGGELGRLRVRQPDALPGALLRLHDRRDLLPGQVLPGGLVDPARRVDPLRARCDADDGPVLAAEAWPGSVRYLPARGAAS